MKKYLYIAIAAATLASCSQDETLDVQKEAITFGEAFVGNSTRATASDPSYTAESLKTIKVWGAVTGTGGAVEVFKDNTVSGTVGEQSVWTCSDRTQYWIPNAKYNFAAVVDGTVTTLGTDDLLPEIITYTASAQKDLLYAKSTEYTGKTSGNDLVKFDFAHLLSKVKFTAVNTTTDTKYTFAINNLTITNSAASGTYNVNDEKWTVANGDNSDASTVFGSITGVTYHATPAEGQTATVYECDTEKFLIPEDFTTTKLNITFNLVWSYDGKEVATESNLGGNVAVNLLPGNAYNFVISKGLNTPIQFTVETLPSWTNQTAQDVTVQ